MRPYFEVGERTKYEVCLNERSACLHSWGKAMGRAMAKVDKELEDAEQQKRVAALSYNPVPLDEQKEKLVKVFEALSNIAKQSVRLVKHTCSS